MHNHPAYKMVLKRFEAQKHRGTEGFGFLEITKGIVTRLNRAETEKDIKEMLKTSQADEILFHHRFPTSTPNFIEATHPIFVRHDDFKYSYYVVHNGVITNDDTLRDEHIKAGFEYTTEMTKGYTTKSGKMYSEKLIWNDSEALAIDLCNYIEHKKPMKSRGSIALVAIQMDKETFEVIALYYGRNEGNPLCLETNKDYFALSSVTGKSIPSDALFRFDYAKNEVTDVEIDIGTYFNYKAGNGYNAESKWKWNDKTKALEEVKPTESEKMRLIGFTPPTDEEVQESIIETGNFTDKDVQDVDFADIEDIDIADDETFREKKTIISILKDRLKKAEEMDGEFQDTEFIMELEIELEYAMRDIREYVDRVLFTV